MNTNTNTNMSSVDSYKQFSEYALIIYKFMVGLIDKYGIMTVDWMGYVLGLNKNGKPISKQSAEELSKNFMDLAEELKKPEVKESIMLAIKESEPILKEAMYSIVNVVMSTGEFALKDGITFICSDTPAAPICGLFKFAQNTVEFGQDLLDGAQSSVNTVRNGEESINKVKNTLNSTETNQFEEGNNFNNLTKPIDINQKGGVKALKKYSKDKKIIETRINKSISEFFNLKLKRKTRRKYK